MSKKVLAAGFALVALLQLGPISGIPDAQESSTLEDDEVVMLQLSKAVAHRGESIEPQHAREPVRHHLVAAAPRESHAPVGSVRAAANETPVQAAVAPERAVANHTPAQVPELSALQMNATKEQALQAAEPSSRPPPDIMLVLFVACLLCAATFLMYYIGLTMVSMMCTPASAAEYENAIDLTACFAGIIICFCSYGIAQEFIITQDYDGDRFPSVPFLILSNRIFIVCVAIVLLIVKGERVLMKPTLCTVMPGASSMISSWCQYECLHYVTFPTQVVFKSAKIVPTMIINTVVNRVWSPFRDYVEAIIITGCVVGFSLLTEKAKSGSGESNTFIGLFMLSLFLLGDALTSNGEKKIYVAYPEFTNTQMMFAMGIVGMIYSGVTSAFSNGGYPVMFAFISKHPECLTQMLALSLCSMSGQYLIYYIIQRHGPVVMAIMMTVRQILSIFVSAALYGHDIPVAAKLLAAVCFVVVLAKPLFKWMSRKQQDPGATKEYKGGH